MEGPHQSPGKAAQAKGKKLGENAKATGGRWEQGEALAALSPQEENPLRRTPHLGTGTEEQQSSWPSRPKTEPGVAIAGNRGSPRGDNPNCTHVALTPGTGSGTSWPDLQHPVPPRSPADPAPASWPLPEPLRPLPPPDVALGGPAAPLGLERDSGARPLSAWRHGAQHRRRLPSTLGRVARPSGTCSPPALEPQTTTPGRHRAALRPMETLGEPPSPLSGPTSSPSPPFSAVGPLSGGSGPGAA
ncbi:predicted GPI-anchored protein 58 [Prionailurus viverrinus]|uniref:predicted GPI-anchored protein 58 n=1 Tax=Prionailurus viverrinus TaxID=61388 RepID=UPI001FF4F905|nr:predicted GPI-anchored protein 58 [Prionailurus viverrinus]